MKLNHRCNLPVFQMLCAKGAAVLQSKSINVEDAANELINMLCTVKEEEEEEEDDETEEESSRPEGEQQQVEGVLPCLLWCIRINL